MSIQYQLAILDYLVNQTPSFYCIKVIFIPICHAESNQH